MYMYIRAMKIHTYRECTYACTVHVHTCGLLMIEWIYKHAEHPLRYWSKYKHNTKTSQNK